MVKPDFPDRSTRKSAGDSTLPSGAEPQESTEAKKTVLLPGSILLNRFRVDRLIAEGGIGAVYLVHQIPDGHPFAVKIIPEAGIRNTDIRCSFIHELRLWMDLPSHPNLTACRFFRSIDGNITVFAEYASGGSLKDWIRGDELTSFAMILDLAIQIARGIHAAHECGVIHQDIKPANVLISGDRIAKVTDFGLSRTLHEILPESGNSEEQTDGNPEVSVSGMTLAYCSPEQISGQKVSRKTDIWSYGVLLLEMLIGKLTWKIGAVVDTIFERLPHTLEDDQRRHMTERLHDILSGCLQRDPLKRWSSMADVEERLIAVYETEFRTAYPRTRPILAKPSFRSADLYTRQTINLGRWDDPMIWLRRAKQIAGLPDESTDPDDSTVFVSSASRALRDLQVYEKAEGILEEIVASGGNDFSKDLALLKYYKAMVHQAANDPAGAIDEIEQAARLFQQQADFGQNPNETILFTGCWNSKAITLQRIGRFDEARESYQQALKSPERLIENGKLTPLSANIHRILLNLASLELVCCHPDRALELTDRAIAVVSSNENFLKTNQNQYDLSVMLSQKALCLVALSHESEAVSVHRQALSLAERICADDPTAAHLLREAQVLINLIGSLTGTGAMDEALTAGRRAIRICETLCHERGMPECLNILSTALSNTAYVMNILKLFDEAEQCLRKSKEITEDLIYQRGQPEHLSILVRTNYLLSALYNHQGCIEKESQHALAMKDLLTNPENRSYIPDHDTLMSITEFCLGGIAFKKADPAGALEHFRQSLAIQKRLVDQEHLLNNRTDMALSHFWIARILAERGDLEEARVHFDQAMPILKEEQPRSDRTDIQDALAQAPEIVRLLRRNNDDIKV